MSKTNILQPTTAAGACDKPGSVHLAGSACERIVIQSRKILGNVWSDYCAFEERTLEDAVTECAHLNSWAKNTEWRVIARSEKVVWPNVELSDRRENKQ